MKTWIIVAILIFILGVFINTIKDMLRSTNAYAKRRQEELTELEKKYQQQEASESTKTKSNKNTPQTSTDDDPPTPEA
ncbi:hypothetical protein [Celerinatantimonas sp. YJH-8]|uniref:hypothetical protein n=1 Tax=Celerinatantimonas sp. YJH-8 TaxID=3228714 RepID=UPI0038C2D1AC